MQKEKRKILVVDDELEIVGVLRDFLSRRGYEVSTAFNGQEALEILEKKRPDLILLDIRMPGITGEEVAKIVKEKYPSIKIILVTGYLDEGRRLLERSFLEGLLIKPVRLPELYEKLSEVLEQKEISILESESKQQLKKIVFLTKGRILLAIRNISSQNYKYN